ncbi:hypothetical protein ACOMHN_008498 [Nucella lapillus]
MALSVAYPPMPPLPTQSAMGTSFMEPSGGAFHNISCGFEPFALAPVKTEPQTPQETGHPPSFLHPPPPSPFSPLSSANFSHLKHSTADLYPSGSSEGEELNSWTYKHPDQWQAKEVLDWVFSLTEDGGHLDGALLRGENYNSLTGKQLVDMCVNDFLALDQHYGARLHDVFNFLVEDANFQQPLPPDSFQSECFYGGYPPFYFQHHVTDDVKQPRQHPPSSTTPSMSVYMDKQGREVTVSLDGLGLYDIDVDFTSLPAKDTTSISNSTSHRPMDDSDYHSGSEGSAETQPRSSSSDVFEPLFSDEEGDVEEEDVEEEVLEEGRIGEERMQGTVAVSRKPHMRLASSCDSGCEGEEVKAPVRKRQASSSKGNHLWEFIRDLLKNPLFNPTMVRWEDRDLGVFKFVQSEAVAQLWGRKKNNPQMTYEKLSRAMRFCRSAGYFESVPKTGRFPKKLCFKFGHKAHGWQE